jgi:hypothetical protein
MMNVIAQPSADWAGNIRSWGLIWGLPRAVIIVGFFVDEPLRTVMWVISLGWMGTACLLNARRCGRTHCRFMGPYYLTMIIPVLILASGIASVGLYGWLALGAVIIFGSKIISWATERAWGKFS